MLRFVLRYLTAVATDLNGPKTRNPALLALDWCLQRCSAANKAVRVRLLVFAGQLLEAFHGTYMDSGFGEYASERLCALLEDRVGEVRVEAAKCLAWLPSLSATCVVALTDAVQDGDAAVRVQALKTVGATASQADWQPALDALVERTRDDDEAVRGEAYGVLGRLQASWFSAEQMRAVVRSGLHGAADSARDQCALLVLSSWLPHHHNDPEVLLGALCDVDTSPEALDALIDALVAGGLTLKQAYFRERIDALSVPLVKLWATAAAHLPADERESLLPPLAVLVKVLLHYADEPALFEALCALVPLYDLSLEEAARADLSSALRHIMGADSDEVLPSVRTAAQRTLMCLHPDPLDWAQLCLETVSDLVDADASDEGVATPQWMAALVLATGLLQEPRLGLHVAGVAQLRALVLLPSLQTADPAQRTTAVRALGVYCTLSIEHAVELTRLFATVLNSDVAQVRAEATRVLLDLCLLFGCSYAERLDEAALAELARGPTLPDELNPVLARVLAPLAADEHRNQGDDDDDDDAVHLADLEQAAWVGVAKMLLHDRLHSPPLLGRVLAKAAAGDAQMAHFARLYQERLPQINTPRLRRAIKWAAPRVRGGEQGKALHALALQWNVSCDDVAADALAKGGDPEALHTFCGGGDSPASDALRQAMLAAAEANKSAAYLRALFDWCHDRHVHLSLAGAAVEPAAKKAKSNNQRHKASTKRARAPEAPTAALAKRSHVIDDQLQRETAKWHASNAGIDDFELGVEVATTPLRKPAARPAPVLVEDGPPPAPRAPEFDDDDHAVPAEDKDATIAALRKRLREAEQLVEQQLRKRQQQQQQDHYQQHVESVETPVHLPIRAVHADDERTLATGPASGAMAAVSGVSARNDVYRMMEAVGLRPYAQAGWSNKITHLICGDLPAPTSKTVAAALCGAWLCPLSWLQACASAGHLVDESSHGCWRRPRRLLLQRSVWLSPAFCHEKRDHFSLATVESLVYTLGLAVRAGSPLKADVVLVAKSEPATAYGDASVYTWASLTAELTTPPLGQK